MTPQSASVVICAYTQKRWDDVLAAVDSVRRQTRPPDEIIVVVDHNPELLSRLRHALPSVTVVPNAGPQGLSGGKNTGIATAGSDVVAFLDDDAVAEPDWLRFFLDAYIDDDILGVGGTTWPWWETRRPRWWPEEFDWVVGCTFVGREPGPVRNLLGGNASFRREAFGLTGGFDAEIGRTSTRARPLGCEETELCIRMAGARPGTTFLFEEKATIWHRVPEIPLALLLLPFPLLRGRPLQGEGGTERRRRPWARRGADLHPGRATTGSRPGPARCDPRRRGRTPAGGRDPDRSRLGHVRLCRRCGGRSAHPIPGEGSDRVITLPVLMYHSVAERPASEVVGLSVHPGEFERQLDILDAEGFTTVTFSRVAAALAGGSALPPKPVALTFDDGYADFHAEALPRLSAHRATATLFVTTGWLADAGRHASGRPLDRTLSWSQLAEASEEGVEIGAHSHSHPQLDQLPDALLHEELVLGKSLLEDRLGHAVRTLAYPYGYSSPRVRAAALAAGYDKAAAVGNRAAGTRHDGLAVPRLTVRRSTDARTFRRIVDQDRLTGLYLRDRALTAGYGAFRRSRSAFRTWSRRG